MLVLGIETSCDETAAAIFRDGTDLLSNVISDQIAVHSKYGGVVPELAGRAHIEQIHRVIQQALEQAGVKLSDIDLISVTRGPGLMASLLVGLNVAKGISYASGIPMIAVNHLEGHLLAIFLQENLELPYLALGVSGGHTDLYHVSGFGDYKLLGRSRDDAAGEAFDKVAKMLGLGYPGGPIIDKMAQKGDPKAIAFPRAWLEKGSLDFSFSGLKTSVRYLIDKRRRGINKHSDEDIAASFQAAVVEVLVKKLLLAKEQTGLERVVITGGVAANSGLRTGMQNAATQNKFQVYFPEPIFCTDNAAMIACAGYHCFKKEPGRVTSPLDLDAKASFPL
jgi:N6-L-threonylcarbamoyladenine synthase